MRVSLLQIDSRVGPDDDEPLPDRVERVAGLVREQSGADLVLLPELWPQGAFAYRSWAETAEPLDGPVVAAMCAAARDAGAWLHMGSLIERDGDRLFNTSVLIDDAGEVRATYRKLHRFGFSEGEPRLIEAGSDVVTVDTPWGRAGLATCYDLRFPEQFRALVDRGAELLLVVAGWPSVRVGHWSLLARARAVEDQLLVLACNAVGQQGRTALGGRSLVVDPWGTVLAEAGTDADVLTADVDVTAVAQARADFPVLGDRRL